MSLGPKSRFSLEWLARLNPRARLRLAIAGLGLFCVVATLATCGGCGRRAPGGGDTTAQAGRDGEAPPTRKDGPVDAAALRDLSMWANAKDGEDEDLTTLAVHEGAIGLVEASSEPDLRPTAIRAMAYARGWAQLPFLAKVAAGKDDEEARAALESTLELATRPRTAEDPEDAEELSEGCEGLTALARDASRPRTRRIAAIRALRMLPCPPPANGEELPSDLDAQ